MDAREKCDGCEGCTCEKATKGTTLGEAAADVLRGFGEEGATAAEVAGILRRTGFPTASTPNVTDRLRKYARRGAVKVEYFTAREGDTARPAETVERFRS